jgi:hypothetical protein
MLGSMRGEVNEQVGKSGRSKPRDSPRVAKAARSYTLKALNHLMRETADGLE